MRSPSEPEKSGAQSPQSSSLEFTRQFPDPPIAISTGLTTQHLEEIARWEETIWGESPKPFEDTVAQLSQELGEEHEIWREVLDGKLSLEDNDTLHRLRGEIGDGVMASVGVLRRVLRDDVRVAAVLHKSLNQTKAEGKSAESRVSLYGLKGKRFLDKISGLSTTDSDRFNPNDRNVVVSGVGSLMKAGVEALEALRIEPGQVISDTVRKNKIKYSPQRVISTGSQSAAKESWDSHQLPVVSGEEVVLIDAVA